MSFDPFDERLYTSKITVSEETIQDTINATEKLFSLDEIQKMAALIKRGGRFEHIKDAFPYTGSFSDVNSHEGINAFNSKRDAYYAKLDKLYRAMIS